MAVYEKRVTTVNALKEGWDCPFAYILASLADKTSAVDVEQVLGRVLRMPHVQQHGQDLLNLSYVFTASQRFMDTLQSVVKGLHRAGFSDRDYRAIDAAPAPPAKGVQPELAGLFSEPGKPADSLAVSDPSPAGEPTSTQGDVPGVSPDWEQAASQWIPTPADAAPGAAFAAEVTARALTENQAFEAQAQAAGDAPATELEDKMNRHKLKDIFRDDALGLRLPQFFIQVPTGGFFAADQPFQLFEREELLKEFRLSQADATISFADVEAEFYRVDLEQVGDADYAPRAFKLAAPERERFAAYLLSLSREGQEMNLVSRLSQLIGNLYPITDPEIQAYIRRIVGGMDAEQLRDCIERDIAYVRKIKQKITTLTKAHAEKTFSDQLDVDRIVLQPGFMLPEAITPSANASAIPKSLYAAEASMGYFEGRIINDVANLEGVQWWHRNLSRGKGFRINGLLNSLPGFHRQDQGRADHRGWS